MMARIAKALWLALAALIAGLWVLGQIVDPPLPWGM